MINPRHVFALFAATALLAFTASCSSDSEAQSSSAQSGDSEQTSAQQSNKPGANTLAALSAIPHQQRTVEQDLKLASLYALQDQSYEAFEALAAAVSKGFGDGDRLVNDESLISLHSSAKWGQVMMFARDNKAAGRTITPPRQMNAAQARRTPQQPQQSGVKNVPSPDWAMEDINGDVVRLSDLKGKIVVLDFWATWCGPCKRSMPLIDKYVREQMADDVVVYSVNVWDRGKDVALNWWTPKEYSMKLLFGDRALTSAYGVRAIPHIVVIDANGIIRQSQAGFHPRMADVLKSWTDQARNQS